MSRWKRPESLEFPKVYRKFLAKDVNSENVIEYRIQELPEERFNDGVEFLLKYYCPDEPMLQCKGAAKDPVFREDISNFFRHTFKKKITIACFKDGSNEILGMNVMDVIVEGEEPDFEPQSKYFREDHFIMELALEKSDHFKRFNVDKYLTSWAFAIKTDCRGRGIGTEILKARIDMLKHLGLELTSTGFTSMGSITAAEKAGYKCVFEINYKDFENFSKGILYPGITSPYLKQMYYKLEQII